MNIRRFLPLFVLLIAQHACAQPFTRQDSLRGGNGRGRDWWDVQHYKLKVSVYTEKIPVIQNSVDTVVATDDAIFTGTDVSDDYYGEESEPPMDPNSIRGNVTMRFKTTRAAGDSMQIDLQTAMILDSAFIMGNRLATARDGNVYWLMIPPALKKALTAGSVSEARFWFHGKPRIAKNPPWDGGFIWKKSASGKPWIAVACQGLGASAWWPCKDDQADEPDRGVSLNIVGRDLNAIICNGTDSVSIVDPITNDLYNWSVVKSPINLYNVTFYIGDYTSWTDTFQGESGTLPLSFHALRENETKARKQFLEVKPMLRCFEYWLGPYPFYADGYKLVEAPYLGMEHQSAVAYGNQYKMGYLGRDLSNTGEGLKFDFIIIHESGHEWFGNNITAKDVADNWIHEGLCSYTEVLYLEWIDSKEAAYRYMEGRYAAIENKGPVIGPYGVNKEGEDIYNKGAAILHMVRLMMNNDVKFRLLLCGMNKEFYHQTVTTKQIEDYIEKISGLKLKPFFQTYLRTTAIPTLQWYEKSGVLHTRWLDAPENFIAPVTLQKGEKKSLIPIKTGAMKNPFRGEVKVKASGLYQVVEREFAD